MDGATQPSANSGATPDSIARKTPRLHQVPLAATALAFAIGILIDVTTNLRLTTCLITCIGLLVGWAMLLRLRRHNLSALSLLLAWTAAGAASHHLIWSAVGPNEVSNLATTESTPIELTAMIDERPSIRGSVPSALSVMPPTDRTLCRIRVRSIRQDGRDVAVTGRAQLIVSGHLIAQRGDVIRLHGEIQRPLAPGNPGEFDYRSFLRRQGVHCIVRVRDPLSVRTLTRSTPRHVVWFTNRARRIAGDILRHSLDADTYPIAAAVLLGERDQITRDLRDTFAESGTMHLLAISGLHVGILAMFLWQLSRLLHLSPRTEVTLILLSLIGYTLITDMRPSILRASVLLGGVMISRLWYRRASGVNLLSGAALLLLMRNATDLFDVGAQLSFLAVVAINWGLSFRTWSSLETDPLAPMSRRAAKWVLFCLERDVRMMLVVSAITGPLVAYAFNLYAPVGIAINLVLISVVRYTMVAGYLVLAGGFVASSLAALPAFFFSNGLRLLHWTARLGSDLQLGHRYGPAPSASWLVVFYGLFTAAALLRDQKRRWLIRAMVCWGCVGIGGSLLQNSDDELRCTVLDVGHGSAVLVEAPNGQTLLVDAGSIDSPIRAQRAVQDCLWHRGRNRIDLLAITHADLDHFSGVELLSQETRIGAVVCPRSFLQSRDPGALHLHRLFDESRTPVRPIQRGQQIVMGDVLVDVLHPGETATNQFEDDNASSLVLLIRYAGRRLLLTGDISGKGRTRLLASPVEHVDMMLAPHHGGRYDNSPELNAWARPDFVVASSRRNETLQVLQIAYPTATSYLTRRDGAVTCTVERDGTLRVEPHRSRSE